MFVDIHAHAYRRQPVYIVADRRWAMPETLVRFYDKYEVEKGVLLPIVSPECNTVQSNDDILEAAERFPGRFIPFCNIDPRTMYNSPDSPLEQYLERYKELRKHRPQCDQKLLYDRLERHQDGNSDAYRKGA